MSANELAKLPALTQSSLRRANAETVGALRGGDSERDFGDKWGTSASTVGNVHNQRNDLSLQNFLMLGQKFGPQGVNAALALVGLRAAPSRDIVIEVGKVPHKLASILPLLIEFWSDDDNSAEDMRKLEAAGAVDAVIELAEYFQCERAKLRNKGD